jgi:hypothetical protein
MFQQPLPPTYRKANRKYSIRFDENVLKSFSSSYALIIIALLNFHVAPQRKKYFLISSFEIGCVGKPK